MVPDRLCLTTLPGLLAISIAESRGQRVLSGEHGRCRPWRLSDTLTIVEKVKVVVLSEQMLRGESRLTGAT